MATNLEPHRFVILVKSTKIGTHENSANHSQTVHKIYMYLHEEL